ILLDTVAVAFTAIRNVDQFLGRIPPQRIDARAVRDGRHDLTRARIHDDGCLAAAGEDTVRPGVIRDPGRPFARRERPRRGRLPRFGVDHLDRVLALVVTKMRPLPSDAAPSGAVSSSSTVATMSPVLGSIAV